MLIPRIEFNEPGAAAAVGKLTIMEAPEDNEFIDITDGGGSTSRLVFDHGSDQTRLRRPRRLWSSSNAP